jgi:hypothetical protein
MKKFKDRYVLGVGYPYCPGGFENGIRIYKNKGYVEPIWSKRIDIFDVADVPRYRLILEKVRGKK